MKPSGKRVALLWEHFRPLYHFEFVIPTTFLPPFAYRKYLDRKRPGLRRQLGELKHSTHPTRPVQFCPLASREAAQGSFADRDHFVR